MFRATGLIGTLIGCIAATGSVGAAEGGGDRPFVIEVSSIGEAGFSGECIVSAASGESRIEITGSASFRREVSGRRLNCTVRQSSGTGGLLVEIRGPAGNVNRSRTTGVGSTVRVTAG